MLALAMDFARHLIIANPHLEHDNEFAQQQIRMEAGSVLAGQDSDPSQYSHYVRSSHHAGGRDRQHRAVPTPVLTAFNAANPAATVAEFSSQAFQPVKTAVKADLNKDQGGLCVYCEGNLAPDAGQVEHIKPKGGPNAYPLLCFKYSNDAHSCINTKTCGQKKKNGLLPVEPGPGCNAQFA